MAWITRRLNSLLATILLAPLWLPVAALLIALSLPTTLLALVVIFIRLTLLLAEASGSLIASELYRQLQNLGKRMLADKHDQKTEACASPGSNQGSVDFLEESLDTVKEFVTDDSGQSKSTDFSRRLQNGVH